jgi:predicted alpha/beta hydrolase family esterase
MTAITNSNLPTLVVIGGGEAFDSDAEYLAAIQNWNVRFYDGTSGWKTALYHDLSERFTVLLPTFPCKQNAKYAEWKLFFEKFAPALDPETTTYVGHSLGGIFLAKYFSENPMRARSLHLVAAPFEKCGTFELVRDLSNVSKNVSNVHLWHSKDDPVVEFAELEKYRVAMPEAVTHVFKGRLHFNGERFDELETVIRTG